jgi:hypothetical protein
MQYTGWHENDVRVHDEPHRPLHAIVIVAVAVVGHRLRADCGWIGLDILCGAVFNKVPGTHNKEVNA